MKDQALQNIDSYINARTAQHRAVLTAQQAELSALLDLRAQVASIQEAVTPPPPPPPPPVVVTPKGIDAKARGVIPDGRDNRQWLQQLIDEAVSTGETLILDGPGFRSNANFGQNGVDMPKETLRVAAGKTLRIKGINGAKLQTYQEAARYGLVLIDVLADGKIGIDGVNLHGPKDDGGGVWYPNQLLSGVQGDGSRLTIGVRHAGGQAGAITVKNLTIGDFAQGLNCLQKSPTTPSKVDFYVENLESYHADMSIFYMGVGGSVHVFNSKFHNISTPPDTPNGFRGHPFYLPNSAKGIWIEGCEGWDNGGYFAQVIANDGHEGKGSDYCMFRRVKIGQKGDYHLSGICAHPRSLTVIDDCDISTMRVGVQLIHSVAVINSRFKGYSKDPDNIPLSEYSQQNPPRFLYIKDSVFECKYQAVKIQKQPASVYVGGSTFVTTEEPILLSGSSSEAIIYTGNNAYKSAGVKSTRPLVNGAAAMVSKSTPIPDLVGLASVPASAPKIQTVD